MCLAKGSNLSDKLDLGLKNRHIDGSMLLFIYNYQMKTCCWGLSCTTGPCLLMAGSLEDIPVPRIMLDCGSAINIIPLKMLLKLGYTINDLSPTNA